MWKKLYKKGLSTNALILLVVGIVVVYLFMNDGFNLDKSGVTFEASGIDCTPKYEQTLSSITSGVTHIDKGNNNHDLILTSTDLNIENVSTIAWTLTSTRTDECRSTTGGELSSKVDYVCTAESFHDIVDPSDSTTYYPLNYSSATGKGYEVTVDGIDFAVNGVHDAQDTATWSTAGSSVFTAIVEDYTEIDQGVAEDYAYLTLLTCETEGGSVTLKYLKD